MVCQQFNAVGVLQGCMQQSFGIKSKPAEARVKVVGQGLWRMAFLRQPLVYLLLSKRWPACQWEVCSWCQQIRRIYQPVQIMPGLV